MQVRRKSTEADAASGSGVSSLFQLKQFRKPNQQKPPSFYHCSRCHTCRNANLKTSGCHILQLIQMKCGSHDHHLRHQRGPVGFRLCDSSWPSVLVFLQSVSWDFKASYLGLGDTVPVAIMVVVGRFPRVASLHQPLPMTMTVIDGSHCS